MGANPYILSDKDCYVEACYKIYLFSTKKDVNIADYSK